jgi:hypothetical protein
VNLINELGRELTWPHGVTLCEKDRTGTKHLRNPREEGDKER